MLAAPAIETADAFIVWSGPVNITIPSTTAGIYLNVVTGVFQLEPGSGPWLGCQSLEYHHTKFLHAHAKSRRRRNGRNRDDLLQCGALICDRAGQHIPNPGSTTINPGTPLIIFSDANYVGFRFINEAAGGQIQYGWLQISISGSDRLAAAHNCFLRLREFG